MKSIKYTQLSEYDKEKCNNDLFLDDLLNAMKEMNPVLH